MTEIGFVGAGAGTAATAFVIDQELPDADITILEKSNGVCGRAAARRRDAITYDYGANYLKDDDQRVVDLITDTLDTDGLVDITEPVWTFDSEGTVSEGRAADAHKWTYTDGITQLAKRLFSKTDATVHRQTQVTDITRDEEHWYLADTNGTEWGPFDDLVMNPPAPQTATLLSEATWNERFRSTLVEAIEAVPYRTIWTAVLGYERRLDVPYYALVNTDKEHDIGWISREECKSGHVPNGESVLIVQANHDWAISHYDSDPNENVAALASATAEIVGEEWIADPTWTDHQGWRYALPEDSVNAGPIETAAREHNLYFIGDWVPGKARLHAALRCGLETGEQIAHSHT